MSDAGAIGVAVHDIAMLLSKKYYKLDDADNVKSHIGFNLVFLKDLVNIIQNEERELEYLKEKLNS